MSLLAGEVSAVSATARRDVGIPDSRYEAVNNAGRSRHLSQERQREIRLYEFSVEG
jgi:hypothetical protein